MRRRPTDLRLVIALAGRADGPSGAARLPLFVVSHDRPEQTPENGVYSFRPSFESALAGAHALAGVKRVVLMGGATSPSNASGRD